MEQESKKIEEPKSSLEINENQPENKQSENLENPETDEIQENMEIRNLLEYIHDSLNVKIALEIPDLEQILLQIIELLKMTGIESYRKSLNKIYDEFAVCLKKTKTERPLMELCKMVHKNTENIHKSNIIRRMIRFLINTSNHLRLYQKEKVGEKVKKEEAVELRKQRKINKKEDADYFFILMEILMEKLEIIDNRILLKIHKGIAEIGKKAEFKFDSSEIKDWNDKKSLIKIFLSGIAQKTNPEIYSIILKQFISFITNLETSQLSKISDILMFYETVLKKITEAEIEKLFLPQLSFLLKRDIEAFRQISGILQEFNGITCHSLAILLGNLLGELIGQDKGTENLQPLLLQTLKSLISKLQNSNDPKQFSEIIESLIFPFKAQLGASELTAGKQFNLVKILTVFIEELPKNTTLDSKEKILTMLVELFASIKEPQISAECAVFISRIINNCLPEELYKSFYEMCENFIINKSFVAAKSKEIMTSLLYPIISHAYKILLSKSELLANFTLSKSNWKSQVSQLNLNAVTQSSYNTAILSIHYLLEHRDSIGKPKEEEKTDSSVKFTLGNSILNKRDQILQKKNMSMDAILHIQSMTICAFLYPNSVEAQFNLLLPSFANSLVQYSFSNKSNIRDYAINATRFIFKKYSEIMPETAFNFSKYYQMATFAFIKHASNSENIVTYIKRVIGNMIEMLKSFKTEDKTIPYFIRLFILIHNSKAAGGPNKGRALCNQTWEELRRKIPMSMEYLRKNAIEILKYLTTGQSIMSNENPLISEDQVYTIVNICGTLAKEGLGKEALMVCKSLLSVEKVTAAEKFYAECMSKGGVSKFEYEFLAEELEDLRNLMGDNKPKEEKKSQKVEKSGPKKPAKEQKKGSGKHGHKAPSKEEGPTKEEKTLQNISYVDSYAKETAEIVRKEAKNALVIISELSKQWHHKDLVKEIINLGILSEIREIMKLETIRFPAYLTLKSILRCLSKDAKNLAEAYFASVIQTSTHKYIKICTQLFTDLLESKIEMFDTSFITIVLDIAEYLIGLGTLPSSVKSKVLEVVIRILLETTYDVNIIKRLTPIAVELLRSSYHAENLVRFLHAFWTLVHYNDMQDIVKNVWSYDLSHQISLFHAIYAVKRPLPNSSWLSNTLLQSLYSENKEMTSVVKNIFNERTIILTDVLLEEGKPSRLIKMLNFKAKDVRDSAVRAISGYLEIRPSDMPTAMKILISEFDLFDMPCKNTISDILNATAHILPSSELKEIFRFLLMKGVAENNEVSKEFMETGIKIIQAQGKSHASIIISAIEELLNAKQKMLTDNANTIAVIFIGNVARYLTKDDPKLPKLYKTLQDMLSIKSEGVNIAVAKCISYFASIFTDDARNKIKSILDSYRKLESKTVPSPDIMRTQAFTLAGMVKGLGIKSIDEFEIMKTLDEPFKEKSDLPLNISKKEYALYIYAALSNTLGKTFEFYAVGCIPNILQSFAVVKEHIRAAAQQASKAIISKLSGQGVKSILPALVKELDTSSWRQKLAAIECLGSMAFMAPKQLSNYLPMIVSNIKIVLNDTQPKVHEAGIQALTAIGSVIKNPEISEISGKMISALKNPTKEIIHALDLLLQQSFAHAIDAPSLSLIIPILDYGLRAQNNEVKLKATQLVGSICKLIGDPQDMIPYLPVVMPALKTALFDPIPEVRSASAKALGALCKGLGLENMQEVIVWLKSIMHKEGSPVERSGAAQGYAEIIAEQGTEYLEGIIEQLLEHMRDKSPIVREAYTGLFLFLPLSFGDAFEKYFTVILPVVLEALTDPEEPVRNSANRVVQICIRQYGKKRTDVLMDPLINRMLDSKWKIRENALGLMADLLLVIETDMTHDKPQFITPEEKNKILAVVYILRYDGVDSIRVAASQVWKGFVENQPKTLKAIMPTLINEILELVATRGVELAEIGVFALHDLAEKYADKLTFDILKIYKNRIAIETQESSAAADQYVQGIATCLYEILQVLDNKIATEYKWQIHSIIEPFIIIDDEKLRETIANIFVTIMNKDLDNDFQKKLSKMFCTKLLEFEEKGETEKPSYLQDIIRMITLQRNKFGDEICRILTEEPLTPMKISTFTAMTAYLVNVMFTQYKAKKLLEQLFKYTLSTGKTHDATIEFMNRCTELLVSEEEAEKWAGLWVDYIQQSDNKPLRAKAYLKVITHMYQKVKEPYLPFNKDIFEFAVPFIDLDFEDIPVLMVQAIIAITDFEAKENQHPFVARIKKEIDLKKRDRKDYLLPIFNRDKNLDLLLPLFQNTLTHASTELRIDAASAYRYAIELSDQKYLKDHAAKIAGSLIRVVNDKFPLPLKNELFECICSLLKKAGNFIKAFAPPLHTTLMKAATDVELTAQLRSVIMRSMAELIKLMPKTDSLRTELLNQINLAASPIHATAFSILAVIGKIQGNTLKPEIRSDIFTKITAYLAKLTGVIDESNVAAAGFALANICYTNSEAAILYDLVNKYAGKPEIYNYLLYAALFAPFGNAEVGSKFVTSLTGKIKFTDKSSMARVLLYTKIFIPGINPIAANEIIGLLEDWLAGMVSIGWENSVTLLELLPIAELDLMKIESEKFMKLKGDFLKFLAKEFENGLKEGMRDLLRSQLSGVSNPNAEIKKLEEAKVIDHAVSLTATAILK